MSCWASLFIIIFRTQEPEKGGTLVIEKGDDMESAFIFVLGLTLGLILSFVFIRRANKPSGTLRVDRSDPDGPYLFLELHTDVATIMDEKRVTFDVDVKNYISRE